MYIMYQFQDISGIFILFFLLAKYAKFPVHLVPPNCTAAGTGKRCRARPPWHPTREEARGRSQTSMLTSKMSGSMKNPMVELMIYHIYTCMCIVIYHPYIYIYMYIHILYISYIYTVYIHCNISTLYKYIVYMYIYVLYISYIYTLYIHCIHTLYIYTCTLYVYIACVYIYIHIVYIDL